MNKKKILSFILAGILVFSYLPTSKVEAASPVLIYEADSKVDNGADYVIIKNTSTADLDLTNWYVADSDRLTRLTDENKIGKVLAAGETLRLEDGNGFNFGLGKSDEVVIFDENKQEVTSFKWSTHAVGAYQYDETTKSYIDTGVVTETSQETVAETPVNVDKSAIVINEIESKDPNGGPDWIELYNSSDTPVDISGWIIADEKGLTLLDTAKTAPFAPGTIIEAKGYLVIETKKAPYDFGMGGGDAVQLFDAEKNLVTSVTYPDHAKDTWGRLPDGQGDLVETKATRGMANEADLAETPEQPVTNKHIVINEVESNGDDRDWIEIFNNSDQAIDISGWYVSDDSDDHKSALVPSGTMLPAKSYFLFTEVINGEGFFDFGLGGADIARLFNANGELVDSHKWAAHATFGLSRIPNGTGDFKDVPTTRMAENKDAAPVEEKVYNLDKQVWPGEETVTVLDTKATFLEDTSGLDTFGGYLWVVDNDFGKFWKLQMLEDGTTKFAEGWEDGKQVVFKKDANNPDAKGPDTEGISLDANCNVYFATERDNGSKGVNFNTILMVDPNKEGTRLVADNEWDLTDIIDNARKDRGMLDYKVSANLGIETVEYISAAKVDGKIIDQNTGKALKASDYNPINGGFMFVGLEDDGFIYVVSLEANGQVKLVSQIDSGMGLVMGQHFNELTGELWLQADNGRDNTLAKVVFNGTDKPEITYYKPPKGIDTSKNNEGFALADEYTLRETAPGKFEKFLAAYWVEDGAKVEALRLGWIGPFGKVDPIVVNPPVQTEAEIEEETIAETSRENDDKSNSGKINNSNGNKTGSNPQTGDVGILIPVLVVIAAVGGFIVLKKMKEKEEN